MFNTHIKWAFVRSAIVHPLSPELFPSSKLGIVSDTIVCHGQCETDNNVESQAGERSNSLHPMNCDGISIPWEEQLERARQCAHNSTLHLSSSEVLHSQASATTLKTCGKAVVEDSLNVLCRNWLTLREGVQTACGEATFKHLENLVAFIGIVKETKTFTGIVSAIVLYANHYVDEGVISQIVNQIGSIFGVSAPSTEEVGPVMDSQLGEGIFEMFKSVFTNFKLAKDAPIFSKIMKVLSVCVTMGLIKKSSMTFTHSGMTLFAVEALKRQATAVDFLDAVLETVMEFAERSHKYFSTGKLLDFFRTDTQTFDEEYAHLNSAILMLETGRLAELGMDEYEFDRRLEALTELCLTMVKNAQPGAKSYYSSRLEKLKTIRVRVIASQKEGSRPKPYAVLLYGKTGVGKTAISNSLVRHLLRVNKFDATSKSIITLNEGDEYQSEYRTYHSGVIMDDISSVKATHCKTSPLLKIIQFINNIPVAALSPIAELKGLLMIQPAVVLATTNDKDLKASETMNYPIATMRRFDVITTMTVKEEFQKKSDGQLDPTKAVTEYGKPFPEFNRFTVERAVEIEGGQIAHEIVVHNGRQLKDIDLQEYIAFINHDSKLHYATQKKYVDTQNLLDTHKLCKHDYYETMCSECAEDKLLEAERQCLKEVPLEEQGANDARAVESVGFLHRIERYPIHRLSRCTKAFLDTPCGTAFYCYTSRNSLKQEFINWLCISLFMGLIVSTYNVILGICVAIICLIFGFGGLVQKRKDEAVRAIEEMRSPSKFVVDQISTICGKRAFAMAGTLVGICAAYTVYKTIRSLTAQMSAPLEHSMYEKTARPKEDRYLAKFDPPILVTEKSSTTSFERLQGLISAKLAKLSIRGATTSTFCNILPVKSNVWMLPHHMVQDGKWATIELPTGYRFQALMSRSSVVKVCGDLALWYLPEGGDQRDITEFFPMEVHEKQVVVHLQYFDGESTKTFQPVTGNLTMITTNQGGRFPGYQYHLHEQTFKGLCMGVAICQGPKPYIAGLHLAGKGNIGAAGVVTLQQITNALERLSGVSSVLLSHSSAPVATEQMGVKYGPFKPVPEGHFIREVDGYMRVHGKHTLGGSTTYSKVRKSIISDSVAEVMDLPKIHAKPPEMSSQRHWKVDLEKKSNTACGFDSNILDQAYEDYVQPIREECKKPKFLVSVGKLSDDANLAGLDGVDGINSLNFSTAKGFPEKGPKSTVSEESGRLVPGITCVRDLDPKYFEEVKRLEAELLAGRRINSIFKGALKDEPTKIGKDKVRVFAGSNLAFTLLTRRYYLSLSKLMQDNPLLFECAVGVVNQSPEWTDYMNYVYKYGKERIIAGDYASFDGKMSPRVMMAAFKILIELAHESGNYDEEDIIIMRGIATEICNPTYDFNGFLLTVFGSNPSGHPLTVVINSIVNSLYMRYCYFCILKRRWFGKVKPFREVVALMTYGDDNIMSVLKGFSDINHTAFADEFAKLGITYTMADKGAESVPYIHAREASFLKHYAVWDDELELYRCPVEINSIQKMLHTHLASNVLTPAQSSAEAIQNAALKLFEFGREEYTKRREQLLEVARRNDLLGLTGEILTYDQRLKWYREKFDLVDPDDHSGIDGENISPAEIQKAETPDLSVV